MPNILALPPDIISKIAAGEVIERPAFAIKELIENAIDAKASSIRIELKEAGLKQIKVTDNGLGMSKDDISECYKPHTTSKIRETHDLQSIKSMGFRGEALWSISAISKLNIKSKRKDDDFGTEIELQEGKLEKMTPCGMSEGTILTVDDLFFNVPARKSFLNKTSIEFRVIVEIVMKYALSFPKIAFFLSNNKKTVIDLHSNQDTAQRTGLLFGSKMYENLLPFKNYAEYTTIHGFIAKPQIAYSTPDKQYIFVNNRAITDKAISATIKQAFGTLLEPRVFPFFILFLEVPYERVDVNVHPRKEQISFAQPELVHEAIRKAVTEILNESNLAYHDLRWKKGEYINNTPLKYHLREGETTTYAGKLLKETTDALSVYTDDDQSNKKIIQLHNLYLIVPQRNGFLLIDQHAAHERILYEQFLSEFQNQKTISDSIILDEHLTIELSPSDKVLAIENKAEFQKLGFDFTETKTGIAINQIPEVFKGRKISLIVQEWLEDINNNTELKDIDLKTHKMLAYLACRTAIKAGDKLNHQQAKKLVDELFKLENRYTCPHGRPIVIEITLHELHKLFHRR